jgi:mono/diheme cytochrome c family protein
MAQATVLVLILALIFCCLPRHSARRGGNVVVLGTVTLLVSAGSLGLIPTGGAATAVPGGLAARTGAAGPLYRRFCVRCHGADGRGERGDRVPDFTQPAWQRKRSDAQLAAAILEGKGSAMPAFGGRLSKAQARALAAHVRAFAARASGKSRTATDFDAQFRRLQKEYDDLRKQLDELTAAAGGSEKSARAVLGPRGHVRPAGPLFRQLCQRCHGASGEGVREKGDEEVPDFRLKEWHQQRSDAQLLASILKGTYGAMPAFHRKIDEAEARGLVAFVRGFVAVRPNAVRPAATASDRFPPESVAAGGR